MDGWVPSCSYVAFTLVRRAIEGTIFVSLVKRGRLCRPSQVPTSLLAMAVFVIQCVQLLVAVRDLHWSNFVDLCLLGEVFQNQALHLSIQDRFPPLTPKSANFTS